MVTAKIRDDLKNLVIRSYNGYVLDPGYFYKVIEISENWYTEEGQNLIIQEHDSRDCFLAHSNDFDYFHENEEVKNYEY